jgi:hypothetical protein
VGFTLRLPPSEDPLPRLVSAAAQLLSRHRLLSCCVLDQDTQHPYYGTIADIDPARAVSEVSEPDRSTSSTDSDVAARINALVLDQLNKRFDTGDTSTLLWRITLSVPPEGSDTPSLLALTISHVISDGVGARRLATCLLEILGAWETLSDPPPKRVIPSNDLAIPPSMEDVHDVRPSIPYVAKVVWRELIRPKLPLPRRWLAPPPIWSGEPVAMGELRSRPMCSRIVFLPSLVATSRSNKITVQPVLQALVYASMSSLRAAAGPPPPTTSSSTPLQLLTETPVGLDRPDSTVLGNYVSVLTHAAKILPTDKFWAHARSYAETLNNPTDHQKAKEYMGMLSYVLDKDKFARDKLSGFGRPLDSAARFDISFEVSNVGAVVPDSTSAAAVEMAAAERGRIEVENAWFGQAPMPIACPLELSALSYTKESQMALHVGWLEGLFKEEWMDGFVSRLEKGARRLVEGKVTDETTMEETVE